MILKRWLYSNFILSTKLRIRIGSFRYVYEINVHIGKNVVLIILKIDENFV
jgi:mRNA-degrading endonuclease RelE of RelBE toxin-antitoxin system